MGEAQITEGTTKLLVPTDDAVFFNPHMRLNRDITVCAVNALPNKRSFCDALAGTGAKGIRVANETGVGSVLLNDLNPNSIRLMKKNIRLNGLKNVEAVSEDANILLSKGKYNRFNIIDIDPFGSPAQFIDSAMRAILPKGALLCVTATDTGALCGSFAGAALRRYGIRARKTSFYNEFGVRALIGFCVREAAKYDIGLRPAFSHATRHYYRTYLLTERGREAANRAARQVVPIHHCAKCERREYTEFDCHSVSALGPIWSGKLFDKAFVRRMEPVSKESGALIAQALEEADYTTPYYDIHVLAKKLGKRAGRFGTILSKISGSRTHFNPLGIKTEAGYASLVKSL